MSDTDLSAGSPPYRLQRLFDTVVAGDFCIGCGVCASLPGVPITMSLDARGQYVPVIEPGTRDDPSGFDVGSVCPFAATVDEDAIAEVAYADVPDAHPHVGRYRAVFAGHTNREPLRANGSSGGLTSWTLSRLMEDGYVDGVIHVVAGKADALFEFGLSRTVADMQAGAKSRYYPVELSGVLDVVRNTPGRYALVGVPCFVKAARLLTRHDAQLRDSLTYFVAIFCGHLKTTAFAESFAWQLGITPGTLRDFDFRVKLEGRPAYEYGVRATQRDEAGARTVVRPVADLFGGNWGHGFFKPLACDFCDDVAGETADVSFGDAWLPEYHADARGTNVVVVRDAAILALLERGVNEGELTLDRRDVADVYRSQAGNYRHRREGLAVRLEAVEAANAWHPPKRVVAAQASAVTRRRRRVYALRSSISRLSHEAYLEAKRLGDFELFRLKMAPLLRQYDRTYMVWWRRWARHGRRTWRRWRNV